jgi:uncharacterized membrane protein
MATIHSHRVSASRRIIVTVVIGVAAGVTVAFFGPLELAVVSGWNAMAAVLLVWIWREIWPADASMTAAWSAPEDNTHGGAVVLLTTASVVSLVGMAFGLAKARSLHAPMEQILTTACVLTVIVSWALVHTMFTLRYAHLYYRDPEGGIDFHTDEAPDYHDFAYLAFTVGMAFAVSDTDLVGRHVRRTCTRHALVSYFFGAVIVGLTINVMAGFVR